MAKGLAGGHAHRTLFESLDLTVAPGDVVGVVGANGAGKTTLLRAITGLCTPDRGSVRIAGVDIVRDRIAALAALAFLPQSPRFHPRLKRCRWLIVAWV